MIAEIERRLRAGLNISHLEIRDDSDQHAGHRGNTSGGGHFTALIVSSDFQDQSLLARHRLVYDALGDLMGSAIHAFSMKTVTDKEFENG
jgi:BolA protein